MRKVIVITQCIPFKKNPIEKDVGPVYISIAQIAIYVGQTNFPIGQIGKTRICQSNNIKTPSQKYYRKRCSSNQYLYQLYRVDQQQR